MSCIDNIVTLGICDDEQPSSGLTLMQAGGMSPLNLDNIANELDVQGKTLAEKKKKLAITLLRNDFIGVLQSNKIATTIADPIYNTSSFAPSIDKGIYAGQRGVVIHANNANYKGVLRKRKVTGIQCYPLTSGVGEIVIVDSDNGVEISTPFAATFVAGKINSFAIDYVPLNGVFKVLIDNSEINFASAPIVCLKGCNNTMPNTCGWADGWDGRNYVKSEGFGINVQFKCFCDYDQLICDLSKSFVGELIWLKWQELIYDEQRKTNRFDGWVLYNRDELPTIIADLNTQYNTKWNQMIGGGLFKILQAYRDDCLECRGVRTVTNI